MSEPEPRTGPLLPIAFALMGAFALASQTALFREYLVVYGGNELGTGIFFSSWLAWVGVGALAALRLRRRSDPARRFATLLALYPAALLLQLLLIRSLRSLAGVAPTDLFPARALFLLTLLTGGVAQQEAGRLLLTGAYGPAFWSLVVVAGWSSKRLRPPHPAGSMTDARSGPGASLRRSRPAGRS